MLSSVPETGPTAKSEVFELTIFTASGFKPRSDGPPLGGMFMHPRFFIRVQAGTIIHFQTELSERTLTPEWNAARVVTVAPSQPLRFEVFCDSPVRPIRSLGSFEANVEELQPHGQVIKRSVSEESEYVIALYLCCKKVGTSPDLEQTHQVRHVRELESAPLAGVKEEFESVSQVELNPGPAPVSQPERSPEVDLLAVAKLVVGSFPSSVTISSRDSTLDLRDPLFPGTHVGTGIQLGGELVVGSVLSPVTTSSRDLTLDLWDPFLPGTHVGPAIQLGGELVVGNSTSPVFEIVRKLGTHSYAVVYLVRLLLHTPPAADDMKHFVLGDLRRPPPSQPKYGREYAIRCFSKAKLDAKVLTALRLEANIRQSPSIHPNIVSLHFTLESDSLLLLILEYVPGENLFSFLELLKAQSSPTYFQARPISIPVSADPPISLPLANTPSMPTPITVSHPSQLLSHCRLRLIASIFSQMCDAVATCHKFGVFHRDIKPGAFIVTDGFVYVDGRRERKVVVKLTGFELATNDEESKDKNCGSVPYMSYECRSDYVPTYALRHADVWSLGIVLINMLYHRNPWSATAEGACKYFSSFRVNPIHFFMQFFNGMTREVAKFLANKVFCILDDLSCQRVSAANFGQWVKDLPTLMGDPSCEPLL